MILQTVRQLHCVLVLACCLLQMKSASGQGWQGQFGTFSEMWWAEGAALGRRRRWAEVWGNQAVLMVVVSKEQSPCPHPKPPKQGRTSPITTKALVALRDSRQRAWMDTVRQELVNEQGMKGRECLSCSEIQWTNQGQECAEGDRCFLSRFIWIKANTLWKHS